MSTRGSGIVCGLAAAAMATVLMAQSGGFGPHGPMNGRGWGGMRGEFVPPVAGAPFTAVRTTTHTQTLANGTTISNTSTVNEARDSNGRTYSATTNQRDGQTFTSYRSFDPVANTMTSWTANSKIAYVMTLPDRNQSSHWGQGQASVGTARPMGFHRDGVKPTVQNLGSQTINGVVADGKLTTFVIPAGQEGNSEALTITHQSWYSSDLHLVVQRTDTDPRMGTTTMNLSNIRQAEPPATLFQAPSGYTIKQVTRGERFTGQQ